MHVRTLQQLKNYEAIFTINIDHFKYILNAAHIKLSFFHGPEIAKSRLSLDHKLNFINSVQDIQFNSVK